MEEVINAVTDYTFPLIIDRWAEILTLGVLIASWLSPPLFGNPIIEAIEGGGPVRALQWLCSPSDEFAARKLILSKQGFFLQKLADHMRDLSTKFEVLVHDFRLRGVLLANSGIVSI